MQQIHDQLAGYSLIQVDTETGKRSRRDERIEWLLRQLTGCEAATVVNNNAAATMLVLASVARGKEVIVSRGQLVEIGGSFRLPDVMAASGARLVEVGTTNKTHARDYENAITENTAAILRVHPSNYTIVGFTAEVPLGEMADIAHGRGLVMIDDVGAGALLDFSRFGFPDQPILADSIRDGADILMCSADKLIGGPQGGIILGKAAIVEKARKNPLARIVRVDKITLAALEATLSLFLDEETALREVPTLAMLSRDLSALSQAAERIANAVRGRATGAVVGTTDGASEMGSGSLPAQPIPTRLVSVASTKLAPDELAARLRKNEPPVFARIQEDRVLCDPRTLLDGDEQVLIDALVAALS
jgi:L-seryl-tRNA(Ser) seleniumtransferase